MIAIRIRTLGYSAVLLAAAAVAGCGGTQETEKAPAQTENAPAPASPIPAPTEVTPAPPGTSAPGGKPEADKAATPDMPPKIEAPQPSPVPKEDEKKADAAGATLTADELAEIKKLPPGEAEAALKQKVCPVSGDHLGSMDAPIKISAAGRTFFLCCKGCSKEVASDPAGVVAKLKK
jgi:YHS domain-containing protein